MAATSLSPCLAVVPTLLLVGPLALFAPAVLTGLGLLWRRWAVLWLVTAVIVTLTLGHFWFRGQALGSWWSERAALYAVSAGVALCGAAAAWWRQHGGAARFTARLEPLVLVGAAVWLSVSSLSTVHQPVPEIVWTFEAVERGAMLASPRLTNAVLYAPAAHSGWAGPAGAVYCLARDTGTRRWTFNADGDLKQVFSSPALHAERLYIGEGLHEDAGCRLFCLDADSGREVWRFRTASHIESSPCVTDHAVFFGAGDDGVYCVAADDGRLRWHFPGVHVDATPVVVEQRLYAGSGYGRREVFCLNAAQGVPLWRTPCELPAFGSPSVADGRLFIGLGNGKATTSANHPAGALLCLDAATGVVLWQYRTGDLVLGAPVVTPESVLFTSRDAHCYCVEPGTGRLRWSTACPGPVVAAPVLHGTAVYVVTAPGRVAELSAATGAVRWQLDLAKQTLSGAEVIATPALSVAPDHTVRLYIAAGARDALSSAAVVWCVRCP